MDSIMDERFLENAEGSVKIAFTLKIDSLGEVNSAHIRWSKNLKYADHYEICNKIESNFRLLFLYTQFKDMPRIGEYVKCDYVYNYPRQQ